MKLRDVFFYGSFWCIIYSNLYSHPPVPNKRAFVSQNSLESLPQEVFRLIVNTIFTNPDYIYDPKAGWRYVFDYKIRMNRSFCIREKINTLKTQDQKSQIDYVPLYNAMVVIDQCLLRNLLLASKTMYLKTKACIESRRIVCNYDIQCDDNVFVQWDCSRNVLLYQAVYNEWDDVIDSLVHYGINLHGYDQFGTTVMHETVKCGSKKTLTMLRDHGGNINVPDIYGYTLLHVACGADVSWHDQFSGLLPYYALQRSVQKRLEIIEQLLAWGADINAQNFCGSTPLHIATARGYQDVVNLLLKHGADAEIKNMLQSAQEKDINW